MKMPVTDLMINCKLSGGSTETMYYIHNDYLGSITAITDEDGNLVESLSYDPWGRRRNADDWTDYNVTSTLFDRGYTGHEHLDQFGLINMNGRVYDPFLARFLSPDPFVQAPGYSQNYNRYSYAWNNPLKYTDPSGYYIDDNMDYTRVHIYLDSGGSSGSWMSGNQMYMTGGFGPGSGKHWSDQYRSESGNFMLMNQSTFTNKYGKESFYMNLARVTGNLTTITNPNLIAAFLPAATSTSRRLWGDKAGGFFFEYDPISKYFFVPGTNTIIDIVKEYSNYLSGKSVSGRVAANGGVGFTGQDILGLAMQTGNFISSASDDARAFANGKYVHGNGKVYSQKFYGNQHVSKYSVGASKATSLTYAKTMGRVSTGLTVVGGVVTVADGLFGEDGWQNHHTADLAVSAIIYGTAAAVPLAGWIVGGLYFVGDMASQYYTGKSITENLFY
jgi:RHS repeat-associated protein